jgi:hypothetical protein
MAAIHDMPGYRSKSTVLGETAHIMHHFMFQALAAKLLIREFACSVNIECATGQQCFPSADLLRKTLPAGLFSNKISGYQAICLDVLVRICRGV